MSRYNVLYLASELYPFAKVGGLADVAGSLPKFMKDLEHDVRVFIPKYKQIRDRKYNLREVIRLRDIEVPLGSETVLVSVKSGFIPDSKVQAYFLEYKPLFDRPGVYVDPATGKGWEDDPLRFSLFAKAALETLKVLFWQPDIIHVNDWPSSLLPHYLKNNYNGDEFFKNIRTILTIHNNAYQGVFSPEYAKALFGEDVVFDENHPAWHNGDINFLKAGIVESDMITTVSPSYANQIVESSEHGAGLESVLASKKDRLHGIINGIDTKVWNPSTDKLISEKYSIEEFEGKADCHVDLLDELKIDNSDGRMLIGIVSRLATQKGFNLLIDAADRLMNLPVNLVILGEGQQDIKESIQKLAETYQGRIVFKEAFDDKLAHQIEAGADAFLMPSLFEPCGLNQLYSLVYGTPPIVHATGGLADTIREYDSGSGVGNGFRFDNPDSDSLVNAVERACSVFADKPAWSKLVENCMTEDFSWTVSAQKLIDVYDLTCDKVVV